MKKLKFITVKLFFILLILLFFGCGDSSTDQNVETVGRIATYNSQIGDVSLYDNVSFGIGSVDQVASIESIYIIKDSTDLSNFNDLLSNLELSTGGIALPDLDIYDYFLFVGPNCPNYYELLSYEITNGNIEFIFSLEHEDDADCPQYFYIEFLIYRGLQS